ncbi:MAG: glycosyltransferase family 2 protein [Carbonactinosporaceae bacterium]
MTYPKGVRGRGVKVSVVVPVYNPGQHITRCIASVLGQSMPREDYEVVFVDDGSDDGTAQRLDLLAQANPHLVRVVHLAHSGWVGRTRNVGIEQSRGKYLYFVDDDDYLGDEALERLYAFAVRHGSDVVIGKATGRGGKRVSRELFRHTRGRVSLGWAPLLTLLTPHKMVRRTFLDEHGIRFPEDRTRFEDHAFMVTAYFRAGVISVLADYVCYYWVRRADRTNLGQLRLAPTEYFAHLGAVLDIVEDHTEPGPFRDGLLRHWYRTKTLQRMGGRSLLRHSASERGELFEQTRRFALERFGPRVADGLPTHLRVRSALLRAGHLEHLVALAEAERRLRADVRLVNLRRRGDGLVLRLSGHLCYDDGGPVTFTRQGDRLIWNLPRQLSQDGQDGQISLDSTVSVEDRDVTDVLSDSSLSVVLRARSDGTEVVLPVVRRCELQEDNGTLSVTVTADVRLDPLTAAAGAALRAGSWDVNARVASCGWSCETAVRCRAGADLEEALSPATAPPLVTAWRTGDRLGVSLDIRPDRGDSGWPSPLTRGRQHARRIARRAVGAVTLPPSR